MQMVKAYNDQFGKTTTTGNSSKKIPQKEKTKKTVWIKDSYGIHQLEVSVGSNDGVNSQIIDGLKLGDEVVISIGYQIVGTSEKEGSAESPFMPKPPGKKK